MEPTIIKSWLHEKYFKIGKYTILTEFLDYSNGYVFLKFTKTLHGIGFGSYRARFNLVKCYCDMAQHMYKSARATFEITGPGSRHIGENNISEISVKTLLPYFTRTPLYWRLPTIIPVSEMREDMKNNNLKKYDENISRFAKRIGFFELLQKADFKCPCCGLPGEYFVLEKKNCDKVHILHMYGIKNNREVLFTADHIIPKSWGGAKRNRENIQVLCQTCNGHKSNFHDTMYPLMTKEEKSFVDWKSQSMFWRLI